MIAHASLPSRDPKATALLLAALIDGEVFPFPVVPGAWIAVARDGSGTAIEVYPPHLAHHPGHGAADPDHVPRDPRTMPWEDHHILWRDPSPTLAHRLIAAGYRALTVPTSNVADPRAGMLPGFDSVWVANFDARARVPAVSPFAQRYVSFAESMPVVLRAARATPNPLCVWLHVMETHAPYHVQDEAAAAALSPIQRYARAVQETSERLAGFVRAWKAARGGKAPLIAVFGDHGEEFGEHGASHHATTVHAEQVRVAFLLAGPGVPVGSFDAPVSTTALPATLLDLLGLDTPASMTEPSLLPALRGEGAFSELAVSEVRVGSTRMTGYMHDGYRYLRDPVYDVEMVFDSRADPYEQDDLSARRPELLARLRELARAWDEAH